MTPTNRQKRTKRYLLRKRIRSGNTIYSWALKARLAELRKKQK